MPVFIGGTGLVCCRCTGMIGLDGKSVLLVAPRFFGYERDIRTELERRGAVVDWLPDRPFDTPAMKVVTRSKPSWVMPHAARHYRKLLAGFGRQTYDLVLVVNGQTLSPAMLRELRSTYPRARVVLYLWDSIANRAHVQGNLELFDRVMTFDPQDAKTFDIPLRPLFYGPGFERAEPPATFDYHLSFIGTMHTDRYQVIDRLRRGLSADIRAFWYLYMQAPWVLTASRWTSPGMRHARAEEFSFVPLPKATTQSVLAGSRAVLDIEHPKQIGLTIRTFETLGSGKKLVTTNTSVRDYDFFTPENICVLDRARPSIPADFLETPFAPLQDTIRHRYSIAGWLDELLQT